jgi:hypothetical protein
LTFSAAKPVRFLTASLMLLPTPAPMRARFPSRPLQRRSRPRARLRSRWADGAKLGQLKLIVLTTDGGDATLTPTSLAGGDTITFADVGDAALLLWNGSNWRPVLLLNLADGTTAPVLASS